MAIYVLLFLSLLVHTSASFSLTTNTNIDRVRQRPYTTPKMTTSPENNDIDDEATATTITTTNETSSSSTIVALIGVLCDSEKDASPIFREGIKDLFQLYFNELFDLGCDLGFQGFQSEWTDLPGKYDFAKRGGLFVAVELPKTSLSNRMDTGLSKGYENERVVIIQPGMDLPDASSGGKLVDILKDKSQVVGCIAIRSLTETCGEVKRMYVRKSHRRFGIGKLLAKHIVDHAWNECGYEEIKLDSLERLNGAVTLYENLGFSRIEPYCECPEEDHVCMNMFKSDNI